jgi:catechol 2,3-dioxygenase-like lactoylglutathione lyase family enzyme
MAGEEAPYWAALTPELACTDLAASMRFYTEGAGFTVRFERDGFAYLELGRAQLMLELVEQAWITGQMVRPFGRGINLQIEVSDANAVAARLRAAGFELHSPVRDNWYAEGEIEHGQREVLVQDPDGYLLRFAQVLGVRQIDRGDTQAD